MNIMYEYMVEVDLPLPFESEFISLIPDQRAMINQLMSERIMTSYSVSIENGKLWTTILAESEEKVVEIIEGFPVIDFIEYKINKLAFHNNAGYTLPQFSLN